MFIQQIQDTTYPFDKRPASILASSALILSLVAGALAGVSYAMHWGIPAIGSLSSVSIVCAGLSLMLIALRGPTDQDAVLRKLSKKLEAIAPTEGDMAWANHMLATNPQLQVLYDKINQKETG